MLADRAESGFTHVEPEKYEPRLLHIKGKKVKHSIHACEVGLPSLCRLCVCLDTLHVLSQDNVRIEEVKLRRKYLNSGDVFILDLGLKAIQVGHVALMTDII